jgi:hypothetical protein
MRAEKKAEKQNAKDFYVDALGIVGIVGEKSDAGHAVDEQHFLKRCGPIRQRSVVHTRET